MTKRQFFSVLFLVLLLSSCSGGDGEKTSSSIIKTKTISGIISDPPIMQARVELRDKSDNILYGCGDNGDEICISKSDLNGLFTFKIRPEYLDKISYIKSLGGTDSKTGKVFTDSSFMANYSSNESTTIVSPLTTIIFWMVKQRDLSIDESKSILSSWMSLDPSISPMDNPESEKSLLKANIISGFLNSTSIDDTVFKIMAETAGKENHLIIQNRLDLNTLDIICTRKNTALSAKLLFDEIKKASDIKEIIKSSKTFFLTGSIKDAIEELIKNDDSLYKQHKEQIEINSKFLSYKLINKNIPLETNSTTQLIRYLFNKYRLIEIYNDNNRYSFSGPFLERKINDNDLIFEGVDISQDENIDQIINTNTVYQVKTPLLKNELPGNDNEKRIKYYYNSDISHLYLASKTIKPVFDDKKRDEILQKIAEGYADSGFFEKAETIAKTQITTNYYKGFAYLETGNAKNVFLDNDGALESMKKAEEIFWSIMDSKGYEFFNEDDAYFLHKLLLGFLNLGDSGSVKSNMDRIDQDIIPEINTNDTIYYRIISSIYVLINSYFSNESSLSENEVIFLTDLLYKYSNQCPPNESSGKKYYKMKIYGLSNAASFYARLNIDQKVFEIADIIDSIRLDDGLYSDVEIDKTHYLNMTFEKTWFYMIYMIESFGWLKDSEEAEKRAKSIARSFTDNNSYKEDAYSALASVKANINKIEEAIEIVKNNISLSKLNETLSERIEALTFKNDHIPKIADIAIQNQNINDAYKAINLALIYSDIIYNNGSDSKKSRYKIQKGYLKIAELLHEANDDDFAKEIFSRIDIVLNGGRLENIYNLDLSYSIISDDQNNPDIYSVEMPPMSGSSYYIEAAIKTSLKANELGFQKTADTFIEYAKIKTLDLAYDNSFESVKRASYLKDLIEAYVKLNKNDLAVNLMDLTMSTIDEIALDNDIEDNYIEEAYKYIELAEILIKSISEKDIDKILEPASQNKNRISNISDKTELITKISKVYAKANLTGKAIDIANEIEFSHEKFDLLTDIAKLYTKRDDFPDNKEAMIDIDGDGKPFFIRLFDKDKFKVGSLELDTDSDNDGNLDINDKTPLYNN